MARATIGPVSRDLLGEVGVVRLEHDLPVGSTVEHDHEGASSAASTSAVVTTSPYFVSMS